MMRLYLILFLSLALIYKTDAQDQSSIDFVIKNLGVNVDGHFNEFNIDASFDSFNVLISLVGSIKTSSIETGIDSRDEHLLEEDYFDVENYPYIRFKSNKVSKKPDGSYTVVGSLSIKDISKKLTIELNVESLKDFWKLETSFEVNRQDYNVGGGSFIMSKTVKIKIIHYQPKE